MADESRANEPEPDHFFVGRLADRLPDGGPRYAETPAEPPDPGTWAVAEPWNAATAFLFVMIVAYWVWVLRGCYRTRPFVTGCLPILLAGGVGGTLYHAFRTQRAFFLQDVIPISLLGAAGSVYLTVRLGRSVGPWRVLFAAGGLLGAYLFVNGVLFRALRPANPNLTVNLSYASLAAILLVPIGVMLVRTRFRHAGWVVGGLLSFGVAWFCRLVDRQPWVSLPMGTHWLWHTFGAVTTFAVAKYFYFIEGERNVSAGPDLQEPLQETTTP